MDPYGTTSLISTAIVFPVLGIIAVSLRMYVRLRLRHTYIGVDDWLVLIAVPLVCGHGIIQVIGGQPCGYLLRRTIQSLWTRELLFTPGICRFSLPETDLRQVLSNWTDVRMVSQITRPW